MIDYPYVLFYLILLILSYRFWKSGNMRVAKLSIAIAFVFFVFRAPVVGADTWNYVRYLTGERHFYNNDVRELEYAFVAYREILCHLTSSRFLVMLITYTLSLYPLYLCLKNYSLNIPLSILLFCYMGCLSVYFVGMRQILGIAVLITALFYSINEDNPFKNKILLSSGAIVLSYFFHVTCVAYALIYILSIFIPIKSRVLYIGLVLGSLLLGYVFVSLDIQSMFSIYLNYEIGITERLNVYLENNELNEIGDFNFVMRPSLIAMVTFIFMEERKLNHPFCRIYVIGVVIYNLLFTVPMVHRFSPPLTMFGAICFTWIFSNDKYKSVLTYRNVVNVVCVLVLLYFTRSMIKNNIDYNLSSEERMHPYYFIFQDYNDHPSITRFR